VSKVVVIAKIPAAPGQRPQLVAAMQAALDAVANEQGTRFYIMHEDAVDADVLWMYEMYDDQDALAAHSSSDEFKAMGRAMKPFMGGRPELTFANPIGGKGL
jgi:quinol monooxygenase YgiN